MNTKRVILEMGSGTDLHGGDYTKASIRAVKDAIYHSSLTMIKTLGLDPVTDMYVDVTIGVQQPEQVNVNTIKEQLPYGIVTVDVVKGGLDIGDDTSNDFSVIASAAIIVRLKIPPN